MSEAEAPAVGNLLVDAYLAVPAFVAPDYADHLRDVVARAAAATVLVALLDGTVAGTVTVVLEPGEYTEQAGPEDAEIRMLGVRPDAQGHGVGRLLMERAVELARERGLQNVVLASQPEMMASHRLYESMGFERVPDRDWWPRPDVHLLVFRRPL